MATDQSPPRLTLIISIAVGTVVVLVGLKFVFDSYFTDVFEEEARGKLVTPDEMNAARADQVAKLTNGPAVPIDQAMGMIAKGRLSSALITPQPSDDTGPMIGWLHLHDGEPAVVAPVAPEPVGDGGVAGSGTQTAPPAPPPGFDGGAPGMMNAARSDAGAPKPHAPSAPATGDAGATH